MHHQTPSRTRSPARLLGGTLVLAACAALGGWRMNSSAGAFAGESYLWTSNGSSFVYQGQKGSGHGSAGEVKVADFTGDGAADIVQFAWDGKAYVWRWTGTAFSSMGVWGSGFGAAKEMLVGDFNGDGLSDVARVTTGSFTVWTSDGYKFVHTPGFNGPTGYARDMRTGNFAGAVGSCDDIAVFSSTGSSTVWRCDGWTFTATGTTWGTGHGSPGEARVGDYTGDGLADVAQIASDGRSYFWRSNGTSFLYLGQWGTGHGSAAEVHAGDYTGDGKADLAQFASDGRSFVWRSTGTGLTYLGQWGSGHGNASQVHVANFNGFGGWDVIQIP